MTQEEISEPHIRADKALVRGILNIVHLGQAEEKEAKNKDVKVHYICLTELESRIYLHIFPQRSSPGNPCRNRKVSEADTKR